MVKSLTSNRPEAGGRPRGRSTWELEAHCVPQLKRAQERRITLCFSGHLVGWYDVSSSIDAVVAAAVRWAGEPGYLESLGYPASCYPWPWDAGEDLAIWRGGRLVALVSKDAAGEVSISRFDHD